MKETILLWKRMRDYVPPNGTKPPET
jgi:hypothetical protein